MTHPSQSNAGRLARIVGQLEGLMLGGMQVRDLNKVLCVAVPLDEANRVLAAFHAIYEGGEDTHGDA